MKKNKIYKIIKLKNKYGLQTYAEAESLYDEKQKAKELHIEMRKKAYDFLFKLKLKEYQVAAYDPYTDELEIFNKRKQAANFLKCKLGSIDMANKRRYFIYGKWAIFIYNKAYFKKINIYKRRTRYYRETIHRFRRMNNLTFFEDAERLYLEAKKEREERQLAKEKDKLLKKQFKEKMNSAFEKLYALDLNKGRTAVYDLAINKIKIFRTLNKAAAHYGVSRYVILQAHKRKRCFSKKRYVARYLSKFN